MFSARSLAAALVLTLPGSLAAQFPSDVQTGARVRVWLPESYRQPDGPAHRQRLRANIEGIAADTLRLSVPGTTGTLAVPRSAIRRLDISRGKPSRAASVFERVLGGALVGAVYGATANAIRRIDGQVVDSNWQAAGKGARWGAGTGVVIGILWPNERWRRVKLTN